MPSVRWKAADAGCWEAASVGRHGGVQEAAYREEARIRETIRLVTVRITSLVTSMPR